MTTIPPTSFGSAIRRPVAVSVKPDPVETKPEGQVPVAAPTAARAPSTAASRGGLAYQREDATRPVVALGVNLVPHEDYEIALWTASETIPREWGVIRSAVLLPENGDPIIATGKPADVLCQLFARLDEMRPLLVTYGGRTEVLPALTFGGMRHRLSCAYLASGAKFANFSSRFSHEMHADMQDILSGYGATEVMSLPQAVATCGLGYSKDDEAVSLSRRRDAPREAVPAIIAAEQTLGLYRLWKQFRGQE